MLRRRQLVCGCLGAGLLMVAGDCLAQAKRKKRMTRQEVVDTVLRETRPLKFAKGARLPLYIWGLCGAPSKDDAETETLLKALDARGMPLLATWTTGKRQQEALDEALRLARLQQKLGLHVGVSAIRPVYMFFNGDPKTAHVDADGNPFFDLSCHEKKQLGCPFSVKHRYPVIRGQVEFYVEAYKQAGVPLDFVFADWEIDGPIEWNDGWAAAKRCARCRENIPNIDDFAAFQKAYRDIRSEMQRECYAKPILARYPKALVGNYGVYPCDGWRYWYDWFEKCKLDLPHRLDQREPQRQWVHEFRDTAYTFAMPVMYTWYRTFDWYDFENPDYHWFYNMLKVASNAGANTSPDVPIISFVHHTLTRHPTEREEPHVKPMSLDAYKELLWHALLRGHDTLFLWCPSDQVAHEIKPVHEVLAASLEYADFLTNGTPVTFDVPRADTTVVSAVKWGERVLVRRTDFRQTDAPVKLTVAGKQLLVPKAPGVCQVLALD